VGRDDAHADRAEDEERAQQHAERREHASRPPPRAAMAPRDRCGQPEERHSPGRGEHAGDVAAVHAVAGDVDGVQGAVGQGEAAVRERERGAQPRPQPREREHRHDPRRDGERARQRVLAEAQSGPAVHERVVEGV
jgi:hypothetical protein